MCNRVNRPLATAQLDTVDSPTTATEVTVGTMELALSNMAVELLSGTRANRRVGAKSMDHPIDTMSALNPVMDTRVSAATHLDTDKLDTDTIQAMDSTKEAMVTRVNLE